MVTAWELGRNESVPEVPLAAAPTPGETAALYRRRATGDMRKLKKAAEAMGISHVTLIGRENGVQGNANEDVVPWWENYFNAEE